MPDPAVVALATDPGTKVLVFVDGQNLYKTCQTLFNHPLCHPHLLAQELAGPRPHVECRFYTGRPNPNLDPIGARNLDRRLNAMRQMGVTVVTRPLRYHWDWSHQSQGVPVPGPGVLPQQVTLTPWRRPREKGIDLVLGLDVVEFLVTGICDVAIIVSLDRDLYEIPLAIQNLGRLINRPVRLEAAVPVPDGQKQPKTLPRFSFTHQITRQLFQRWRDNTDYTVSPNQWVTPQIPGKLPPP